MCWAIPAKVLKIHGFTATVDFGGGVVKEVIVAMEDIREGDLVLVHAGSIIGKIDEKEVLETLKIYRELAIESAVERGLKRDEAERLVDEKMRKITEDLGVGS
ncbi:MAG: hydrogenase expression/formation protein HypC [Thermoprotei archaeon]|nr:MAG: hydrogenase expression/formation protein HypC [Thermoprotei archaeon]